ncbi:uncharacterized protein METZ01_LOCUS114645 [marine metagenome]|uniref:Uncharacterized protein n=1 Tax=marine metagenome TaxID=408172 RepID=A0A381XBB0_9ZZZZ
MGSLQVFLEVDLCSHQILVAHRVNNHSYSAPSNNRIILRDVVVERKPIRKAATAASRDEYPELEFIVLFALDEFGYFVSSAS